jgi:hypothetical protein
MREWPALRIFLAMGFPILPVPMIPTFMRISLLLREWNPSFQREKSIKQNAGLFTYGFEREP